jgi:hypothetical protein
MNIFNFRLFFVDELLNYRALDNDEVILKIVKEANNKNTGAIKSMLNSFEKVFAKSSDKYETY